MRKLVLIMAFVIAVVSSCFSQIYFRAADLDHLWIRVKIEYKNDSMTMLKICGDTINASYNTKFYQRKKRVGYWVFFRRNGFKRKAGYYNQETYKKDGYWEYYNRNAYATKSIKFDNGKRERVNKYVSQRKLKRFGRSPN
jgi:hypothetical protein